MKYNKNFINDLQVVYIVPLKVWLDKNGNKKIKYTLLGIDKHLICKPLALEGLAKEDSKNSNINILQYTYTSYESNVTNNSIMQLLHDKYNINVYVEWLYMFEDIDKNENFYREPLSETDMTALMQSFYSKQVY